MFWDAYVGIPYLKDGRSVLEGLDCLGLLRHVYLEEFEISLPVYEADYNRFEEYSESWNSVNDPHMGDVIVFNYARMPLHVGIFIGNYRFLHTNESTGSSVIERLNTPIWSSRVRGFYRHVYRNV